MRMGQQDMGTGQGVIYRAWGEGVKGSMGIYRGQVWGKGGNYKVWGWVGVESTGSREQKEGCIGSERIYMVQEREKSTGSEGSIGLGGKGRDP